MMFYCGRECGPHDVIPIDAELAFVKSGIICRDIEGVQYKVCRLDFEYFETEEFQYVFTPYYDVIDKLYKEKGVYIDISGLDLELRKEHYYRANCTPSFVYHHVLPPTRQDLREYLDSIGVKEYFPMEIMIKDYHRFNDRMYVIDYNE